jgi:hypothetical protein
MLAIIVVALIWLNAPVVERDPTQCDIPADPAGLIDEVASVKDSLTVEPSNNPGELDHIRDARKMINPQPSPSDKHEKTKREIIIFTRPNCPPCDQWKRCEQPKFEADGWSVAYCTEHNFSLTPTFIIERNGRSTEHRGYLPFDKIEQVAK